MAHSKFQNAQAMRQHIRHPVNIPIEVKTNSKLKHDIHNTVNLGGGGLAFRCDHDLAQGEILEIRIPFVQPPFEAKARVAWCKPHDKVSEYGIEFLNQDETNVMRMVDQVCRIENYQKAVGRSEGRQLSAEEAAREWIGKHAAEFPGK